MKEVNNLEKAEEFYKKALELNPTFSSTLNNLAVVQTMSGKLDDAKSTLQHAIAVAPTNTDAYNNYGVLSRDEGAIDTAVACYRKALSIDPNARNPGQNLLLALHYLADENYEMIYEVSYQVLMSLGAC